MKNKEKINSILNHFNFEKIHKYIKSINWTWSTKNKEGVLTEEELREEVLRKETADGYLSEMRPIMLLGLFFEIIQDAFYSGKIKFFNKNDYNYFIVIPEYKNKEKELIGYCYETGSMKVGAIFRSSKHGEVATKCMMGLIK